VPVSKFPAAKIEGRCGREGIIIHDKNTYTGYKKTQQQYDIKILKLTKSTIYYLF